MTQPARGLTASHISAKWTSEILSIARVIVGFLLLRHGMEQVLGFPAAAVDAQAWSLYGVLKLLCLPGGILLMLGLLARPAALVLAVAHVVYWVAEPVPEAIFNGVKLLGASGAPSDHLLVPGLFCAYVFFAGPGVWSVDRWRMRDHQAFAPHSVAYSLGALRIVAGVLFLYHGVEKIDADLEPLSRYGVAAVLEILGGMLIILGLFTRPAAFVLSGQMAVAYFLSHAPNGFWASFSRPSQEAAILFCFVYLFLSTAGPGAFSLDGYLQRKRELRSPAISASF